MAAEKAPTTLSQLVMWRLAGGLDWDTISQLSVKWANDFELTLAKDFVQHLDGIPEGETGRLLFQFDGVDEASQAIASEVGKALEGKTVLGLVAHVGEIPANPGGPAVACKVRIKANEATVLLSSSDATANNWWSVGKFTLSLYAGKRENRHLAVCRRNE